MIECNPPPSIPVDVLLGGEVRRGDLQFKGHKYIAIHVLILFPNFTATIRGCYVTIAEEEERNQ